jgi:CopG family nickel-responsive transcriptional regulator
MAQLVRVTVSLEADLLARFDRFCAQNRLATRSEAVRQLVHDRLAHDAWESDDAAVAATLTLVYDHHKTRLTQALLDLQHERGEWVVSTMHVHLDHDRCLEVIVLRGPAGELRRFAGRLGGLKGIHRAELVVAGAGGHGHRHRH